MHETESLDIREKKVFTLRDIPTFLHKRLKQISLDTDIPMYIIAQHALVEYIKKMKKEKITHLEELAEE